MLSFHIDGFWLVFYDLFKYFTNEPQPESPPLPTPTSHRLNMQPNRMNVCSYLHSENIKCMYDFIESDNLVHAASKQANQNQHFSHPPITTYDRIDEFPYPCACPLSPARSLARSPAVEREKEREWKKNTDPYFSSNPFSKVLYSAFVWRPDRFIAAFIQHSESTGFFFGCVHMHRECIYFTCDFPRSQSQPYTSNWLNQNDRLQFMRFSLADK